jgi:arylsulfatase A-like enzyme
MKNSHSQPLNVIYLVAHDLGKEVGVYGSPFETPNVDRFAGKGALFNEAYCSSPCCSPSRGCAMTGQTAHTNGLAGLANPGWEWSLPESTLTITDDFNLHGYETVHAGMQHERQSKKENRYQKFLDSEGWVESAIDAATRYLKERSQQTDPRPFYLNIGTNEVHSGQWETYKHDRPYSRAEVYGSADPMRMRLPGYLPDFPEVRKEWAAFHGCVRYWDEQVGRLLDTIEELGYNENTLVIITTDHGVATHRGKGTVYKEGIEIALAMCGPGIEAGSRFDHLIPNIDFLPTILDACGLPVRQEVEGRSFWPLLKGEPYRPHEHITIERNFHDDFDPMRAIRTPDFMLIENFNTDMPHWYLPHEVKSLKPTYQKWFMEMWPEPKDKRPKLELFDRRQDSQEMQNRAQDPAYRKTMETLHQKLHEWMDQTQDPILQTTDEEAFKAVLKKRFR